MINWKLPREGTPSPTISILYADTEVHAVISLTDGGSYPVRWAVYYEGVMNSASYEGHTHSLGASMRNVEQILAWKGTKVWT